MTSNWAPIYAQCSLLDRSVYSEVSLFSIEQPAPNLQLSSESQFIQLAPLV
jgi:hypothetical protein